MKTRVYKFCFDNPKPINQSENEIVWLRQKNEWYAFLEAFCDSKFGNPEIVEGLQLDHAHSGFVWFQIVAGIPAYFSIIRRFQFLSNSPSGSWEVRAFLMTPNALHASQGLSLEDYTPAKEDVYDWVMAHLPEDHELVE